MSHSVFYRRVKALTGCTATEFIRRVKLRKSRQLLEAGGYTVAEVAQLTGFNSMSNFRQAFKKEFGMLPSAVTLQS
jgi:AraC-like DNA-binding protein